MKEIKEQERRFELRSEKVRSIVGQMPSSLVRYGIATISVVLLCLFSVAYFLPYKQVYFGTATMYAMTDMSTDSIEISILIKFENKCPNNVNGQMIYIQTFDSTFAGQILSLSSARDTLERQEAICRFKSDEIKLQENRTVDFRIIYSSSNLLQKMLGVR